MQETSELCSIREIASFFFNFSCLPCLLLTELFLFFSVIVNGFLCSRHNLKILQTGFLFDSLTGFTPFAFILILSGGKICILKTYLFKEECLFCRCWFCGYSRYLMLHNNITTNLQAIHVLSLIFCGSGVWVWLSWVVFFKVLQGCIQGVSQGCSLIWGLTGEGFASKLTWCWQHLFTYGLSDGGPQFSSWVLAGVCPHLLAMCAFPMSLLAPQSQLERVS